MSSDNTFTDSKRPSGRRSGDSGTRAAILEAARELFAQLGFDGASVRAIAAAAAVDPGMIRHYFGDKETLFAASMVNRTDIPLRIAEAIEGDLDSVGRRVTETYLDLWDDEDVRPLLLSLVRSAATSQSAAAMLVETLGGKVREIGALRSAVSHFGQLPPERFALAASHLLGVVFARYVIKVPALADLSRERLVDELAPTIQKYLTEFDR